MTVTNKDKFKDLRFHRPAGTQTTVLGIIKTKNGAYLPDPFNPDLIDTHRAIQHLSGRNFNRGLYYLSATIWRSYYDPPRRITPH